MQKKQFENGQILTSITNQNDFNVLKEMLFEVSKIFRNLQLSYYSSGKLQLSHHSSEKLQLSHHISLFGW